ncbi:hypothetical protein PROPEN_01570 [Proteus penneri ATCC 35198]|nr:hypothetical protein PROPEN_01570 [Proteus penneri ATCC 35198]
MQLASLDLFNRLNRIFNQQAKLMCYLRLFIDVLSIANHD